MTNLFFLAVDIHFTNARPKHASFVRIQVDNQTYESPSIAENALIEWYCDMYVTLIYPRRLSVTDSIKIYLVLLPYMH